MLIPLILRLLKANALAACRPGIGPKLRTQMLWGWCIRSKVVRCYKRRPFRPTLRRWPNGPKKGPNGIRVNGWSNQLVENFVENWCQFHVSPNGKPSWSLFFDHFHGEMKRPKKQKLCWSFASCLRFATNFVSKMATDSQSWKKSSIFSAFDNPKRWFFQS